MADMKDYSSYLSKGYFDDKGNLREELILDTAFNMASGFGEGMKNSQLRRFYQHAKTAENAYRYHKNETLYINEIKKLDHFVAEAKGKGKVPPKFYDFIYKNIKTIKCAKDIDKGFLPHFQAVVAYFSYCYPKS